MLQDEKEARPDIFAIATGYLGLLSQRRKTWVKGEEFHQKEPSKAKEQATGALL